MLHFLLMGVVLGLSAGVAPGPLLTLVVAETLRHGMKAGIRVAMAPVLTDLPIIAVSVLLLARLSSYHAITGLLSLFGALFLFVLGVEEIKAKKVEKGQIPAESKSLAKGVMVNFLSPHPYLFWLTVGGPLISRARLSPLSAAFTCCWSARKCFWPSWSGGRENFCRAGPI